MRTNFGVWAALALTLGCSSGETEGEPTVGVVATELSSIDCKESTDTGYSSGKPFPITVVSVDGKKVETNTANAYYVMAQAADKAGVTLKIISGFRTMAQQQYLYGCYVNCNCNNCNLAAKPGYSNHQSGHALDLNTSSSGVLSWLDANAAKFGFKRTVPSEDWHWEWWSGGPGGGPCGADPEPAACTPTPVPAAQNELFKDMAAGSLGYAESKLLYQAGITTGCSKSPLMYCPSCSLTRAQAVTFLVRAEGLDTKSPPAIPSFTDVPKTSTYYASVEAAAAAGITKGCSATEFCPDSPVTRAQMAAFLVRARGWSGAKPPTPSFSDVPATHTFYGDIETLKAKCVTSGCSPDKYCPDDDVTRAQAAVFVAKAYDLDDINSCFDNPAPPGGGGSGGFAGAPPEGGAGGGSSGAASGGTAGSSWTEGGVLGTGGDTSSGGASATPKAGDGDAGGCGCRLSSSAPSGAWTLLLAAVFGFRRRRPRFSTRNAVHRG
ncbi:MAG: S-layer homology domain-containing protein [Polyangiaceae bacterium]